MDHSAKLIAALVLSFAGTAHAGYAQARPPSGWSPGTYAPAANDSVYGRVIYSPNGPTTTVGGQAVKMSASYRFAANAPRIAAGIIFANPYVRAGAAIASWLGLAKIIWDAGLGKWVQIDTSYPQSDGFIYDYRGQSYPTAYEACEAYIAHVQPGNPEVAYSVKSVVVYAASARCTITAISMSGSWEDTVNVGKTGAVNCPAGWYDTPAGCVQTPPPKILTKEQFEDALAPKPMPERVPLELPQPSPLPIEQPSPWINPSPGPNPEHQPRFVPSGDPVPNPKFNPDAPPGPNNPPYIQPGTRVVPSPTPSQPWRVDLQPVNRPQDDAKPKPPEAEPPTDPADKPKPEEQQSLCEKHPDIVACARLGEPGQATPVPNETKTLTIAPENGFGPSGASCPPPRTVEVAGITLSMPFDLLCDFATGLKPVIVGLAWLTAAFTFMGIGRRS